MLNLWFPKTFYPLMWVPSGGNLCTLDMRYKCIREAVFSLNKCLNI